MIQTLLDDNSLLDVITLNYIKTVLIISSDDIEDISIETIRWAIKSINYFY